MKASENTKIILFLFLLSAAFFWKIFIHYDEMLYSPVSDVYMTFADMKKFIAETIRNGELPFWNPYLFAGKPGLANLEYNMFYPLTILFILFPSDLVFGYYFMIHIFLTGYFTYLYVNEITKNKTSSLFASLSFMLSRYLINAIFQGHLTVITSITFIPLQLYLIEKIFKNPQIRNSILLGASFALQLLGGHPQWVMYSTYLSIAYAAFKLSGMPDKKKTALKMLKFGLSAVLVFMGLSLIQLIPAYEFHDYGDRHGGVSYEESIVFQMPLRNVVGFIMPEFYGSFIDESSVSGQLFDQSFPYVGVLTLFFAVFAVLVGKRGYVRFYLLVFIVSLLISFGDNTPLYKFFYYLVPGAGFFRVPSRLLSFTSFSLSVLSGLGLAGILRLDESARKGLVGYVLRFVVLNLVVVFLLSFMVYGGYVSVSKWSWPSIVFYSVISFMGIGFVFMYLVGRLSRRSFIFLVCVVLVFDLWVMGQSYVMTVDPSLAFSSNKMIDFLMKDDGVFRVVSWNVDFPRRKAVRFGIQKLGGYVTTSLGDYNEFVRVHGARVFMHGVSFNEIPGPNLLRLLNVKYVISPGQVYVNDDFLPRAIIVPKASFLSSKREILAETLSPDFDPGKIVLIEDEIVREEAYDGTYHVEITSWSPNKIELSADLSAPGFLVLSEVWYPAWNAYVDGEDVRVYKADYVLRSVFLPEGHHSIVFKFESDWFKVGALISLLTALVLIVFFAKDYFSRGK